GVGSLVGGLLSRRFPHRAPQLFVLCEMTIALFGVVSIPLIHMVSAWTLHGSLWTVSLATYALLSLPTIGMGATLPILVGHLNRTLANVGRSVGTLYFINTRGAPFAWFLPADVLFAFFGQQTAVYVAAACNFLVAVLVWCTTRNAGALPADDEESASSAESTTRRRFVLMLLLSAATGHISLSQEIL